MKKFPKISVHETWKIFNINYTFHWVYGEIMMCSHRENLFFFSLIKKCHWLIFRCLDVHPQLLFFIRLLANHLIFSFIFFYFKGRQSATTGFYL